MSGRDQRQAVTAARSHNLPRESTTFVGRAEQIEYVQQLLASTRLLTLVGAGGCGKTRLALQVAAKVLLDFQAGVWFIDLSPVSDPSRVPHAVAQAIGMPETSGRPMMDALQEYLSTRHVLLILDNCEHVIDAAARLADDLLQAGSLLRMVATSREPLRSPGETTWRVPSLSLPPPAGVGVATMTDLLAFEAVELFVDRAQAALPSFALNVATSGSVQEICRQLEGIPLAIELAAARIRVFSVEQIAARLDDRFRLLTSGTRTAMPRQQTLRATVDWSYALLSEQERAVLRRLSVFAGGWTLEAAEVVTVGPESGANEGLDSLASLVDKSLAVAESHSRGMRYRLLETIRQYARERLDESGETQATCDRHLDYFLDLAERTEPRLRGPSAGVVLDELEEEIGNLRAAIDWALQTRPEAALRLTGALGWLWWGRDYHSEGRRWLNLALAASSQPDANRMRALHVAGWLAHHQRDLAEARALLEESLAIARNIGDLRSVAWVLHCLGRVAYFERDPEQARSLAEESLALAEQIDDPDLIAWAHHLLGLAAYIADEPASARIHYERSLAIRRQLGFAEGTGIVTILLGLIAMGEGDLAEARSRYQEGLTILRGSLGPWGVAMPLAALSHIAAALGQHARAVRLAAMATQLGQAYQTPLIPLIEPVLAQSMEITRQVLGDERYALAWAEGQAQSIDAAIAEALAIEPTAPQEKPAANGSQVHLTPAERQVLHLLVEGHTSKQIAAQLVVAVSTVDRHLTHIYSKLGARNRAEATALALKHHLLEGS